MPAAAPTPTVTDDEEPPVRSRFLFIVIGAVLAVSLLVAGIVIFSSDTDPVPAKEPVAAVSAGDGFLSVGRGSAPLKIVVDEDFGSAESREFDIASRDFLRIEAADGTLNVEYHPVSPSGSGFSASARSAWDSLLRAGTPRQALAFHDLIFDQQPSADEPAPRQFLALAKQSGVKDSTVLDAVAAGVEAGPAAGTATGAAGPAATPTVTVDGKPLTASSPTALADALQRMVLDATS